MSVSTARLTAARKMPTQHAKNPLKRSVEVICTFSWWWCCKQLLVLGNFALYHVVIIPLSVRYINLQRGIG